MFSKYGNRRRKIIVDKQFQWGVTLVGILYIIAIGVFLAIPFTYLVQAMNGLLIGQSADLVNNYNHLKRLTTLAGSLFILFTLVAWIYFSLRRSHKVAGPVVNITRIINEFAKGNFSAHVQLRKADDLQNVAQALNNMADTLRAREQTLNENLLNQIHQAKEAIHESPSPDRAHEILEDLENNLEEILQENLSSTDKKRPMPETSPKHSSDEKRDKTTSELLYK